MNTVPALPDVQECLETYGVEDGGGSPEKFARFTHTEIAKCARMVKEGDVKVDT